MTTVKIAGKPYAAAAGSLEANADWLYTHPGGRMVGVVELAHTERSEPAPDVDKDRTVTLAMTALELATFEQEESLRKAQRALYLARTAEGTLDVDGEIELSKTWLEAAATDATLREAMRLRAAIRQWAEKARSAYLVPDAKVHELRHELDAVATGLQQIWRGDPSTDQVHHDEQTLFKVLRGLVKAGLTERQATDAISAMQNEGILFRERLPATAISRGPRWRPIDRDGNIDPIPAPENPPEPDPVGGQDDGETGPPEVQA